MSALTPRVAFHLVYMMQQSSDAYEVRIPCISLDLPSSPLIPRSRSRVLFRLEVVARPIPRPFSRAGSGAILQQAHAPNVIIVRIRFARRVQPERPSGRVRSGFAFQRGGAVVRDAFGEGPGVAGVGLAAGEGDVFVA